jgi:hypothetical protein
MLEDAKEFFEDIAEEIEEFKDKIVELLFEKLPDLIEKWDFDSRRLAQHEITEAKKVFGDKFNYADIRIFEGNELPNFLDDIGNIIKKMPKRDERIKNAITLGNWILFGRELHTDRAHDMSWLIHELTHAWQYQTMGWDYLFKALDAQKKLGAKAYDFGGEKGLKSRRKKGGSIKEFNMEQQGDITKKYYQRLVEGGDTSAWDDYIREIQADLPKPT